MVIVGCEGSFFGECGEAMLEETWSGLSKVKPLCVSHSGALAALAVPVSGQPR